MAKEKNKTKNLGGSRRASGAAGSYKAKNYLFVIAINDYEHIEKLNNCVSDAEAVIQLLTEDFEFEKEEVCFICSGPLKPAFEEVAVLEKRDDGTIAPAKATRSVVLRELRRVAKLIEKDQQEDPKLKVNLLLYYSGHGWYDDFLDQGYWIPVDSELDDYSKYISNGTIQDFLNGIPTHHTLLLSDSCFSGSLFATGTGKSLASTRLEKDPSRWGITAGRNEVVSDGEAGEQSPFINSLLTELRAADTIAVQDLSTKILERVASNDKQTPRGEPLRVRGHQGGQFVFRKKANARKHFEAGQLIMRLARHQPEYARFRAAASQFEMASRLSKKPEDQITFILWKARALGYAGLYPAAIESLDKGISVFTDHQDVTSLQELKQALTLLREPALLGEKLATDVFSSEGNWAIYLTDIYRAKHRQGKDCHLIQVGINKYQTTKFPQLRGCVNDTQQVGQDLMHLFGQEYFNTKPLHDEDATKNNIIQALVSLQKEVRKEDWVFIHFSGHSFFRPTGQTENSPFIITHDTDIDRKEQSMIGHRELHELFEAIPCEHKVIIMDTDPHDAFRALAETGNYALLLATDKGERAKELSLENNKTQGIFSYALSKVLTNKHHSTAPQKPLWIKKFVAEKVKDQTPVFIRAEDFFATISYLSINAEALMTYLLQTFFGARNVNSSMITDELIHTIEQLDLTFSPEQWQRLAEQLPTTVDDATRIDYYEKSLSLYQAKDQTAHRSDLLQIELQLARLYLSNGHLTKAEKHFIEASRHLSDKDKANRDFITQKLRDLKRLAQQKKYALLVGIGKYENPLSEVKGVGEDLDSWKKTLLGLGYFEENITILKDEKATNSEILSQFEWLAKKAKTNPAFFFFTGDKPLPLSELATLSQGTKHLTVVLDGDFTRNNANTSDEWLDTSESAKPAFGNTLLLPGIHEEATGQAIHQYHETKGTHRGALSTLLTMRLQQGSAQTFTELSALDLAPLVLIAGDWLPEEEKASVTENKLETPTR